MRCLLQSEPATTAIKVRQTFGTPGWISLQPGPTVQWIPREGQPETLSMVIDERMCCGTLLRVERLSPTRFVAADMLYLNNRHVWSSHSFAQRSRWLFDLLEEFHTGELAQLVHKDDLEEVPIKGWESYTDAPGLMGCYEPLPPMIPMKWTPTELPDVWRNAAGHLLEVRTLESLQKLRKHPIVPSRVYEGRVEILA